MLTGLEQGLTGWLKAHHKVITALDVQYHIFAKVGSPYPFLEKEPLGSPKEIEIDISLGPAVLFQLNGWLVPTDLAGYIKFPLLPPIEIGEVQGVIEDSLHLTINIPEVNGTVTIYGEKGELMVQLEVTAFGHLYQGALRVLPL